MNRDELLSLAMRCEREEPSAALDLAIANAILDDGAPRWIVIDDRRPNVVTRHLYGPAAPGNPVCSLDLHSDSIDAAKLLEPADAQEIVVRIYPRGAYVRITLANGTPVYCEVLDRSITEAMARCAAALRALAATVPA